MAAAGRRDVRQESRLWAALGPAPRTIRPANQTTALTPLDRSTTSLRLVLQDTERLFQGFSKNVDKLLNDVGEAANSVADVCATIVGSREESTSELKNLANTHQLLFMEEVNVVKGEQLRLSNGLVDINQRLGRLEEEHTSLSRALNHLSQQVTSGLMPILPKLETIPLLIGQTRSELDASRLETERRIEDKIDRLAATMMCRLPHEAKALPPLDHPELQSGSASLDGASVPTWSDLSKACHVIASTDKRVPSLHSSSSSETQVDPCQPLPPPNPFAEYHDHIRISVPSSRECGLPMSTLAPASSSVFPSSPILMSSPVRCSSSAALENHPALTSALFPSSPPLRLSSTASKFYDARRQSLPSHPDRNNGAQSTFQSRPLSRPTPILSLKHAADSPLSNTTTKRTRLPSRPYSGMQSPNLRQTPISTTRSTTNSFAILLNPARSTTSRSPTTSRSHLCTPSADWRKSDLAGTEVTVEAANCSSTLRPPEVRATHAGGRGDQGLQTHDGASVDGIGLNQAADGADEDGVTVHMDDGLKDDEDDFDLDWIC